MALTITTYESGYTSCPVGQSSWGATGSNMVSVGVQTSGNQQNFAIVQCFVGQDGTSCYVQVANNGFVDSIDYQFIVVQASDADLGPGEIKLTEVVTTEKAD